jgi:hypothetical protein
MCLANSILHDTIRHNLCGVRDPTITFDEPMEYPLGAETIIRPALASPPCSGIQNPGVRRPPFTAGSQKRWKTAQVEVFFARAVGLMQSVLHSLLIYFFVCRLDRCRSVYIIWLREANSSGDPSRRVMGWLLRYMTRRSGWVHAPIQESPVRRGSRTEGRTCCRHTPVSCLIELSCITSSSFANGRPICEKRIQCQTRKTRWTCSANQ